MFCICPDQLASALAAACASSFLAEEWQDKFAITVRRTNARFNFMAVPFVANIVESHGGKSIVPQIMVLVRNGTFCHCMRQLARLRSGANATRLDLGCATQ